MQSFSVSFLQTLCVSVCVVQLQLEIVSSCTSFHGIVQVGGRMQHCVCEVTSVQFTITEVSHLHSLLRRAAVAALEAVHYHSSDPRSRRK